MHMPLFFVIAGILYHDMPSRTVIAVKIRTLLFPYVLTAVLSFILFSKMSAMHLSSWSYFTLGLITGCSKGLSYNSPLWFLPCLWTIFVVVAFVSNVLSNFHIRCLFLFMGGICFTHYMQPLNLLLPMRISTAFSCFPFFVVGLYIGRLNQGKSGTNIVTHSFFQSWSMSESLSNLIVSFLLFLKSHFNLFVALVCALLWAISSVLDHNSYYVIAHDKYNPLFCFYTRGISGAMCVIFLSRAIAQYLLRIKTGSKQLLIYGIQMLSSWSFGIYLFHKPIMIHMREMAPSFFSKSGPWYDWFLLFLLGIALPIIAFWILNRITPRATAWILGKRLPG